MLSEEWTGAKPNGPISGVHVFGLTLEESPVTMICRRRQVGNIFYRSEHPGFDLTLINRTQKPFHGSLRWTYQNWEKHKQQGGQPINLGADGVETCTSIPAEPDNVGWYKADIQLLDETQRTLVQHATTFAILPWDLRRAGYESPYGTWWFRKSHFGTGSIDVAGPLFLRRVKAHNPSSDNRISQRKGGGTLPSNGGLRALPLPPIRSASWTMDGRKQENDHEDAGEIPALRLGDDFP